MSAAGTTVTCDCTDIDCERKVPITPEDYELSNGALVIVDGCLVGAPVGYPLIKKGEGYRVYGLPQ